MGGWPDRPARTEYSPGAIIEEKRVIDPVRQIGKKIAELLFWNASGIGLSAPKAVLVIDPIALTVLTAGFAWDPDQLYSSVLLSNIPWIQSFTVNGVGDYTLIWTPTVTGIDGDPTALDFQGGDAHPTYPTGSTPPVAAADRNARCDFELVDPSTMNIKTLILPGATPIDVPFALEAW